MAILLDPFLALAMKKRFCSANPAFFVQHVGYQSRFAIAPLVLFGFAEGQELTEHTSTQSAIVQILSGECEFSLGGIAHPAKAGDLIYMPPNLRHAISATKQFSMLLTLTKAETLSTKP